MLCAFRDVAQLRRWFTPAMLKAAEEAGVEAVTYIIENKNDRVLRGRDQWMFDPKYAVAFERVPPTALT